VFPFRRKKKSNSRWLLPIAFIPFLLGFYLLYQNTSKKEIPLPDASFVLKEDPKDCNTSDNIEYFYYEDIPSDQVKNNKFGLYVYAEQKEFFELAQNLVNSSGGDWGYVLIPYNVATDRDYDKWRGVFDRLYNKHLIPIIQLWAVDPSNYKDQTKEAAKFLDRFIWPIKERYISVYNEPNDSKFWYGRVDPFEYARILNYTVDTFKEQNTSFFMINGALNTSAPTDSNHMDAFKYMYYMNQEVMGIFNKLDGWASHSYPQPNFSGDPNDFGRWSIRAYEDELEFLKNKFGVTKELPVFITETGWAHAEGELYNASYLPVNTVAKYFKKAYEDVWLKDVRVRAVTPFTIWYDPPFDHFSWVNKDNVPYKHYEVIKRMRKVKGTPKKLTKASFSSSCSK
jgi:hypothetical protein